MVLKLRVSPPDGWKEAKCKGVPLSRTYDPFFGIEYNEKGEELDEEESKSHAIDFCNGSVDGSICPIRDSCLIFALTNNAKEGVWGGTDEITRKAIRKKFPATRDGKVNPNWQWMTQEQALEGLSKRKVKEELQQEILEEE